MTSSEFGTALSKIQMLVVVKEGRSSSICCSLAVQNEASQDTALVFPTVTSLLGELGARVPDVNAYPFIVENASVVINPDLRIEFSRVCTVEHIEMVRNVGRIDRDYLKRLRKAFLTAMGADFPGDNNREDEDQKESTSVNALTGLRESNSSGSNSKSRVHSKSKPHSKSTKSGIPSSLTPAVSQNKDDTGTKPKIEPGLHPGMEQR
jgi:hypothetical protein